MVKFIFLSSVQYLIDSRHSVFWTCDKQLRATKLGAALDCSFCSKWVIRDCVKGLRGTRTIKFTRCSPKFIDCATGNNFSNEKNNDKPYGGVAARLSIYTIFLPKSTWNSTRLPGLTEHISHPWKDVVGNWMSHFHKRSSIWKVLMCELFRTNIFSASISDGYCSTDWIDFNIIDYKILVGIVENEFCSIHFFFSEALL